MMIMINGFEINLGLEVSSEDSTVDWGYFLDAREERVLGLFGEK